MLRTLEFGFNRRKNRSMAALRSFCCDNTDKADNFAAGAVFTLLSAVWFYIKLKLGIQKSKHTKKTDMLLKGE